MWSICLNVIKFEFLNYAAFGFHSLLNIMRDFECDRDFCWTWLIFDVLNVNVWNVHVECDVWPWIWSRCLLNLINFHVLNANVIVECDRYPWMWLNLNSWILHHLAFHILMMQLCGVPFFGGPWGYPSLCSSSSLVTSQERVSWYLTLSAQTKHNT